MFFSGDEPEPVCGIYAATGLYKITGLLDRNLLAKHSMKYVLEISKSCLLSSEEMLTFGNCNLPEDRV